MSGLSVAMLHAPRVVRGCTRPRVGAAVGAPVVGRLESRIARGELAALDTTDKTLD